MSRAANGLFLHNRETRRITGCLSYRSWTEEAYENSHSFHIDSDPPFIQKWRLPARTKGVNGDEHGPNMDNGHFQWYNDSLRCQKARSVRSSRSSDEEDETITQHNTSPQTSSVDMNTPEIHSTSPEGQRWTPSDSDPQNFLRSHDRQNEDKSKTTKVCVMATVTNLPTEPDVTVVQNKPSTHAMRFPPNGNTKRRTNAVLKSNPTVHEIGSINGRLHAHVATQQKQHQPLSLDTTAGSQQQQQQLREERLVYNVSPNTCTVRRKPDHHVVSMCLALPFRFFLTNFETGASLDSHPLPEDPIFSNSVGYQRLLSTTFTAAGTWDLYRAPIGPDYPMFDNQKHNVNPRTVLSGQRLSSSSLSRNNNSHVRNTQCILEEGFKGLGITHNHMDDFLERPLIITPQEYYLLNKERDSEEVNG